jgi:hypothetical protein
VFSLLLSALFVVAAMARDWRTRRRVHPIYVWGALIIGAPGPLRFALAQTNAWAGDRALAGRIASRGSMPPST